MMDFLTQRLCVSHTDFQTLTTQETLVLTKDGSLASVNKTTNLVTYSPNQSVQQHMYYTYVQGYGSCLPML